MLTQLSVREIVSQQRNFFNTGETKDIAFRISQLKILKQAVIEQEAAISNALKADLQKSEFEAYTTEIRIIKKEIDYAIKHIKAWTKPQKANIPIEQLPGFGRIYPEPLGVVLIIGTWNYPFQLNIVPLVGAIAAGNCAMIKPSEIAPHTSSFLANNFQKYFPPSYIAYVEGGVEISQQLLAEKFDHIFFTGGTKVGKIVMEAAAKHLTPVTLELGGKSPCIVDAQIDIECTARRIVWGKFINAGQSCVSPDYLLVEQKTKTKLLDSIKKSIREFYPIPATSPDYGRIINQKQYNRLVEFLKDGEIIIGGETNQCDRYIAPTVLDRVSLAAPIMQEEIFGPILPVFAYNDIAEAIAIVNQRPKPLSLYLFSQNKNLQQKVIRETAAGSVCINDTVVQFAVPALPFGGVGSSGIGSYHGKASFDTFSHYKSVLHRSFLFDIKLRYAPYSGKLPLLKRILG